MQVQITMTGIKRSLAEVIAECSNFGYLLERLDHEHLVDAQRISGFAYLQIQRGQDVVSLNT